MLLRALPPWRNFAAWPAWSRKVAAGTAEPKHDVPPAGENASRGDASDRVVLYADEASQVMSEGTIYRPRRAIRI
jgi:hypothetical protein